MPDENQTWLVVDTATRAAVAGEGRDGRCVRIARVLGEVDVTTRTTFVAGLERASAGDPHRIVLDCSAMTFCDVGGLRAVMRTVARGAERGTDVAVVGCRPSLSRLCALLWPGPQPVRYPTVAAAVVSRAATPGVRA